MAVSRNREHMAAIGRRGGEARGQSRGRVPGQANTGAESTLEGGVQNTRAASDRQVSIGSQNEGVNADTLGTRGGNAPLGGERRPQGNREANRAKIRSGPAVILRSEATKDLLSLASE